MNQIVPFENAAVPAALSGAFGDSEQDEFVSGQTGGFPTVSINSKVFSIKRGDEITMLRSPDSPNLPAQTLDVVIIKAHPGLAKIYYKTKYVPGSTEAPDCYSNNGVEPALDAQSPQAKKCALCPYSQWGSRITEDGKKAKACGDAKRVAVAAPDRLDDPMLLRIPATSLKAWDGYIGILRRRGVKPPAVITQIGFDYNVSHPALIFRPVGFVTDAMVAEINETRATPVVERIIGGVPVADYSGEEFVPPAPAASAPAPVAPAPATPAPATPAPAPIVEEPKAAAPRATRTTKPRTSALAEMAKAADAEMPKARVRVEAPAPEPEPDDIQLPDDLESLLANAGFELVDDTGYDDEA